MVKSNQNSGLTEFHSKVSGTGENHFSLYLNENSMLNHDKENIFPPMKCFSDNDFNLESYINNE